MSEGVRCMWMRGGTSKGGYFLAKDLPVDRNAFLLRIMGSPDPRQIDGMGGADPLTSKVAIVSPSKREGVDVDYLFLQVSVDDPLVSDGQNCGNILAGVGPFAIERGLVERTGDTTNVSIFMENTGQIAVATIDTSGGAPNYDGSTKIDGVPGTSAAVPIEFRDTAGSSCGALLPTRKATDLVEGIDVTMIDNGMPVVILKAEDIGITGQESREVLDQRTALKAKLERIRLVCGPMMNLGDVGEKTVPKLTMVSPPLVGGAVNTRTFIPHRCHASIGVLGAVSVATAALVPNSVAAGMARIPKGTTKTLSIEHPSGELTILAKTDESGDVVSTCVLRTARKLFDGYVF
ncbi:MAG: 4-oxalomesaconate tautomerase [Pseudomonadota bacterium]